jgi:ribosomal protein L16 Arg81 hydroxylase
MTPQFSECIAPMSPDEFMSGYRGKNVAYLPGSPTRYASLVQNDELNRVLSRLTVTPGIFRLLRPEGQAPMGDVLTRPLAAHRDHRAIQAAVLEQELTRGATMIVEHCESLFENVHGFCEMLATAFMARVNATLFVVYQPGKPSGLHWDDRDMFVCQVAGRKKWPVYKPAYENPLFDPKRGGGHVAAAEHVGDFLLEAGDALYIPRGWPHNPESVDGYSVHVACALATPTAIDLLDWIKQDLSRSSAEMRADLPLGASAAARRLYAGKVRDLVMERLTDAAVDGYCQRHRLNVYRRRVKLPAFA